MKILFLILALPAVALAQLDDPAWLAVATKQVSPINAWFDVETVANGDTEDAGPNDFTLEWSTCTPTQSGACSKLRIYQHANAGAFSVKMGLWNNDGTSITGAQGTGSSGADGSYIEVTLATPASVMAGTPYRISWISSNSNARWWYRNGTGTLLYDNSSTYTYANFPPGSLPVGTSISRNYCVSMFVQ